MKKKITVPPEISRQFRFDNPVYDEELMKKYALMSQVASMYYIEGIQQPEIAKKLFFSRSKVSRILTAAKEAGIVDIQVQRISERVPSIEKRIKELFPVKDAVIITNFSEMNDSETLENVSHFGALYISNLLHVNSVLGISNGNAVNNVVRHFQQMQACSLQVVQLIGSGSNAFRAIESRDMVNQLTTEYPGKAFFLNTPLYMDNYFSREQLLMDPAISETFQMMKRCDVILTGLGSFDKEQLTTAQIIKEYQTPEHAAELARKGAVGCICALYYDIRGNYIPCEWNSKCIAIPFGDIAANNMTVAIACGERKILPILGGLRSGLIDVMITDVDTAVRVIEANSAHSS